MTGNERIFTSLSEVGEQNLIKIIREKFSYRDFPGLIKGIGDDSAVIEPPPSKYLLVTSDSMVEGVHFDIIYTPMKMLGYKFCTVNFSDIYAMNGFPRYLMVDISLTSKYSKEMVEEFYEGVEKACSEYGVALIGGNVSSARNAVFTGVCIGYCEKEMVVYRNGARKNDIIVLSGEVGSAYAGLLLLESEKIVHLRNPDYNPDLSTFAPLIKKILMPPARKDIIEKLRERKVTPTSMIDLSDGLANGIMHICRESGCGARIMEDKLPVNRLASEICAKFNLDIMNAVMYGGEDYELLFTIRPSDYDKIKDMDGISFIGFITDDDGPYLVNNLGQLIKITGMGWQSFSHSHLHDFSKITNAG